MFGSTTQPKSNTLFGGTSNATLGSGGLFADTSTQQQTAQPQASSLFGKNTESNGDLNQTQAGGAIVKNGEGPRTALFENLLERGKKRRDPTSADLSSAHLPSLQLGLGDISSKIRGLGSNKPDFGVSRAGDSRAQYLLAASGVPQGATRRDLDAFAAPTAATGPLDSLTTDTSVASFVNGLQAKSVKQLMEEGVEKSKRDFDLFVEEHITFDLDEQRRRVYEHFGLVKPGTSTDTSANGESFGASARGAFGKSSRKTPGLGASGRQDLRSSFGASQLSKSVLGGSVGRTSVRQQDLFTDVAEASASTGPPTMAEDPFQRRKQEKYAAKVTELNVARANNLDFPLIEEFARVEMEGGSDTPKHLIDAYRALKEIVSSDDGAAPNAVPSRRFAKDYLDESPTSAASTSIRRRILQGSRRFLEDSFYRNIEELVERNAQEADIGGLPTKISKVRGYVRMRSSRKDLGADVYELQSIGGDYCWVLIFYLLRCGLIKEAAQYVAENERYIKSMDRQFAQYMASYASHKGEIPHDMQQKMNGEYIQRARLAPEHSIDPYRMGCYKIIGRCELNRKTIEGVNAGIDDLIWLYFCLARETNRAEENAGEVFGLEDVRNIIVDIGERWFSPGNEGGPGYSTFFFMQMLGGMFEMAISWLYTHNYVAATHFAIALDFYGLLRISDASSPNTNLLSYTTRQTPQISFARLLGYYTRDFRTAKAEAAADYLILICLNKDLPGELGKSQTVVCQEALKELVLETREFALLLGDIRGDGRRESGVIERRLRLISDDRQDATESLQSLTVQAAVVADDSGRTTDAVLLYHLAEDYESVMVAINKAMSDAIQIEIGQEQMRLQPLKPRADLQDVSRDTPQSTLSLTAMDDPVQLARSMKSLYQSNGMSMRKIKTQTLNTCEKLINMAEVKRNIQDQQWANAVDNIAALGILPLDAHGNMNTIRGFAQNLNAQPTVISSSIGNLLVWAHLACGRQRQYLRQSVFDVGKNAEVEQLGVMSRDIQKFAGMIKHKLPADVFNMLASAGEA